MTCRGGHGGRGTKSRRSTHENRINRSQVPAFVALALLGWLSPSLAAPGDEDIRSKPLRSAAENAAGNVRVAKGFKFDLIYTVPRKTQGSWVAMCVDPKGRLIAADQYGKLYRLTPPPPGRGDRSSPRRSG